jgi:uncharacterized protein (DUF58 family)
VYQRLTIYLLVGLLLVAILIRQPVLALFGLLLLLAGATAWLWNHWSLVRLTYNPQLSAPRAFPGDEVELQIQIANRKPLPLASVFVRELIPPGLRVIDAPSDRDFHGRQVIQRSTGMSWYEGLTWRYRLACEKRGAYRLGPTEIESGDPFGFLRSIRAEPRHTRLLVYPRLLPLETLGLPARRPIGELRARNVIRDPLRTIGVRDYHPDDPLKDVHWPATARVGTLQTRIYESTATRTLAIFLDLDTFERYWEGIDPDQVERLISAAATLAQAAVDEGYAVGLYANGAPAEHEQLARLPPNRSPAQLELILETLAQMTELSLLPMARLLRLTAGDVPWGSTLLLLSAIKPDSTRSALLGHSQRGRMLIWMYLGEDAPPVAPGITVVHAPPRGDWRRGPLTGAWRKQAQ